VTGAPHIPVLRDAVIASLMPKSGGHYVDGTFGAGGYSEALLGAADCKVWGIDRDPDALAFGSALVARFPGRLTMIEGNFGDMDRLLGDRGVQAVDGIALDLGVSSMQLDEEGRGFSFRRDEPLDMRMDRTQGPSAADLLRDAAEGELADVIYQFGEERHSRRVARAIVRARAETPIDTTGRLAAIVRRAVPHHGYQRIDPATRTFQALRIWVNRELDGLDAFLERAARRLLAGARLAVITFHSLEDRIVKHTFRAIAKADEQLGIVTRRPLSAADAEVERNPRARSAKLRAIERFA